MIYAFFRAAIKLTFPFMYRRIERLNAAAYLAEGPILLASNHPNSFLDAVILGTFSKRPVYFITRGDVFKAGWIQRFLTALHMIPIFRMRDGKDKLGLNDETFIKSIAVLRGGGILLIFVEGFCENQTELQVPLKKGAARILQSCWQEGIPARVLPVWLQYSSFNQYGKTIRMSFGKIFDSSFVGDDTENAAGINKINDEMARQLLHLSVHPKFEHRTPPKVQRVLLGLPAMLGAVCHAPLYLPVQALVKKLNKKDVHYDAMMVLFLFATYPLYLLILALVLGLSVGAPALLLVAAMPLLAICYLHWKA